jgi:hypothetical protein
MAQVKKTAPNSAKVYPKKTLQPSPSKPRPIAGKKG